MCLVGMQMYGLYLVYLVVDVGRVRMVDTFVPGERCGWVWVCEVGEETTMRPTASIEDIKGEDEGDGGRRVEERALIWIRTSSGFGEGMGPEEGLVLALDGGGGGGNWNAFMVVGRYERVR